MKRLNYILTGILYIAFCGFVSAQSITIQESAIGFCSVDGVIEKSTAGYTGSGYANGDGGIGKSINWSLSVNATGSVAVHWRYANGGGSGDRKAQVLVDGTEVKDTLNFKHTGVWTTWKSTDTLTLTLSAGKHNVRLISQSTDGLANIDYIQAEGNNVTAATCVPSYFLQVGQNNDKGAIWYEPVQPFYDQGTVVTLHAKAKPGFFFQSWSGDASSTDTAFTFTMKRNTVTTALFLADGTTADPHVIGYATVQDDQGTPFLITGGKGGQVVEATTLDELKTYLGSPEPMVVQLSTTITGATVLSVKSNKTFIGTSSAAHLIGIQLDINNGAQNVIIQNITISHVVAGAGIGDAISINGNARNIWIDHCDLYADKDHGKDYYDGLIDIKNEASFITISWSKLHDHYKVNLVTSNDESPLDSAIRITYHHNYFYNCGSRLPSVRFGKAHVFNNYYKDDNDAISSRMNACIRIEENYFENVGTAVMVNQSVQTGRVHILDNHFGSSSVATSPTCILPIPYPYLSNMQDKAEVPALISSLVGISREDNSNGISVSGFPNPANDHVTLSCLIEKASPVKITLFDLSGKELATIVDKYLQAGISEMVFSTADLKNGAYFYKVSIGKQVITKKLMVVH